MLEHYNGYNIMKLLDNKAPQVEFDNIHVLIIAGMSTNKSELVQVYGYGDIAANDEAADNLFIVRFTYVSYTLQEDV